MPKKKDTKKCWSCHRPLTANAMKCKCGATQDTLPELAPPILGTPRSFGYAGRMGGTPAILEEFFRQRRA